MDSMASSTYRSPLKMGMPTVTSGNALMRRSSEYDFPAVEGLGVAARRIRLQAAQAQHRHEDLGGEPSTMPLGGEAGQEVVDLEPADGLLELHEHVGSAEVAVELRHLVLQDRMIPEGLPGQIGDHPVVLV